MDSCWDPLLRAVFLGRLRLTRLLLEGGAYVNESDPRGLTPLMVSLRSSHRDAQSCGRFRMVRYLLDCGADPNIQDSGGRSSLVHAVLEGVEPQTLSLLLSRGADPSLPDRHSCSALVHAVRGGDRGTLRLLVDACRARGQEVIIVTSDCLNANQQLLNVPPPLDQQGEHSLLCCDCQYRSPPQGASASTSPQPGSPLLGAHGTADEDKPSPLRSSVSCSGTAEERHGKRSPFSRRHSIDTRDSILSALQGLSDQPQGALQSLSDQPQGALQSLSDQPQGALLPEQTRGRSALGRKMSYDSATASRPDFQRETNPLKSDSAVSGLENVIRRRNIGVDHYSSDSQLARGGVGGANLNCKNAAGSERRKLDSKSSPMEKRSAFERRGSGALLLDHIAHTRPGFLPPLNPHAPIPHIGVSAAASPCAAYPCGRRSSLTLSKPPAPAPLAPSFPKDLNAKKTLWRRHSMQSEQIRQLSDFEETLSR